MLILHPWSAPPFAELAMNSTVYVPGLASSGTVTLNLDSAEDSPTLLLVPIRVLPFDRPELRSKLTVEAPAPLEIVVVNV